MYNPWMQNEPHTVAQNDWHSVKPTPPPSSAQPASLEVTLADFAAAGILPQDIPSQNQYYNPNAGGGSSNSTQNASSAAYFSQPPSRSYQHTQHSSQPNSYNHQWSQHNPSPQSSYSSLNGANGTLESTSSRASAQYSPPQSHPPTPFQPNGSSSATSSAPYGYNLSAALLAYGPSSQQAQQPSISPSALQSQPFYNQPQQQLTSFYQRNVPASAGTSPPPQQFISPSALQPQSSNDFTSSQPFSQPSPPPPPAPAPKPVNLIPHLQPHLASASFTGAQAVSALINKIDTLTDSNPSLADLATRLEVLGKIRDLAGNPYFRALSENEDALDLLRDWLRAGCNSKPEDDAGFISTVMPILHIIDRLPLTVDNLKTSKLGKLIKKLINEGSSPAIRDMASNIVKRWTEMLNQAQPQAAVKAESTKGEMLVNEMSSTKKRKVPPASEKEKEKPAKRPAVGTTKPASSSSIGVKKETAKVDNSFFSSRPEKKPLPSFKKSKPISSSNTTNSSIVAPIPVKKDSSVPVPMKVDEPDPAKVAQPSSYNAFQDALQTMRKSPASAVAGVAGKASSATPPTPMQVDSPVSTGRSKGKGKGKRVTWAPDDKLENIRLIEKAIYEDDGVGVSHNLRDLEGGEGAALHHATLFEEAVDWTEPLPLSPFPDERGLKSQEVQAQTQREQTALGTLYMSREQVPDTPAEPSHVLSDGELDRDMKIMILGSDAEGIFWDTTPMAIPPQAPAPIPSTSSVADLLRQIQTPLGQTTPSNGPQVEALLASSGINPSTLGNGTIQGLLSSLQNGTSNNALTPPPSSGSSNGWGGGYGNSSGWGGSGGELSDSGHGSGSQPPTQPGSWARGDRGRGRGRGSDRGAPRGGVRGRGGAGGLGGRGQIPCTFYQQGRCRYGDQCDFMHA